MVPLDEGTLNEFTLLSDSQIIELLVTKELTIKPIIDPLIQIQPTSVDLRLGTSFAVIRNAEFVHLDLLKQRPDAKREAAQYVEKYQKDYDDYFVVHPGEFALASTFEYLRLPGYLAGRLEGKSTWGRLGLQVHSTAGFVDPGFEGSLTFELQNVGKAPIKLYPGVRLGQICFFRCKEVLQKYGVSRRRSYARHMALHTSLYFDMPEFKILRNMRESGRVQVKK